jgi:hypothetical protein
MIPGQILSEIQKKGIILDSKGDQLIYRAPKGLMTPILKATIKKYKAEILDLIQKNKILCPSEQFKQVTIGSKLRSCYACKSSKWWRRKDLKARWICVQCHPPINVGKDIEFKGEDIC